MKSHEPKSNPLASLKTKAPYAQDMARTADKIAKETVSSLETGKMGGIEAAGGLAMASLLKATSDSTMPFKQAIPFLKSLAEKKTPDPVQRIEAHQVIDMRGIILSAVEQNPLALEKAASIALEKRELVKQRIGATDNMLELKAVKTTTPVLPPNAHLYSKDAAEGTGPVRSDYSAPPSRTESSFEERESYPLDLQPVGQVAPVPVGQGPTALDETTWSPGDSPDEIKELKS